MKNLLFIISVLSLTSFSLFADTHYLFIGDSHSTGEFAKEIIREFRKNENISFELRASGGSAALQWINNAFKTSCGYVDSSKNKTPPSPYCFKDYLTPTITSLLTESVNDPANKGKKFVAIVALGANMGSTPAHYQTDLNATKSILWSIKKHGFDCIWVGPPSMPRFTNVLDMKFGLLKTAIEQSKVDCVLIDSRDYTTYPKARSSTSTPDGVHYDFGMRYWNFPEGTAEAKMWARRILPQILN